MAGGESAKNMGKGTRTIFNFDDDDAMSHTTSKYKRTVTYSRGPSQGNTKRTAGNRLSIDDSTQEIR